ncbi:hypothetical protein VE02_07071 [Pseudogymnoascus sp. 03VT05]|nr:hypothetical protein VE02_07071 [Pseudogymnoascus sp. 03VT05]
MGDPDVYCAICGGPVVEVKISAKPRSEVFKAGQRGEEPDVDSDEYYWEERTYDCEIITKEETEWTRNVMVVGFNPNPKARVNGAFLAAFGTYDGFGEVTVHDTFDPNFDLAELGDGPNLTNSLRCYDNLGEESDFEPVFPFHRPCYYLLRRRVGDRIDGVPLVGGLMTLDNDILFGVMRTLADTYMLDIDYGTPNPQKQDNDRWNSNAGEEIFAASPELVNGLEDRIRGLISAGYFTLPQGAEFDLTNGVRQDPFQRLPFDILIRIGEQCEDSTSLLNWAKASWFANVAFRSTQENFWATVIRIQMGWFFELLLCLDDDKLCYGSSMRAVFLWAACRSEPRRGIKAGPFLSIANRRRIWTNPCLELADRYCSELPPHLLIANSKSTPMNFRGMLLSKAMWSHTYEKTQVVEAFFMQSNGFLTAIALTTECGESRMVGSIYESSLRFKATIPAEDWICAIVIHIPGIELVGRSSGSIDETSPKGITIICKSGRELHLGETNQGSPVRALVARQGHQVVGLVAEMAADESSATFTRLGLITLRNEELDEGRTLHDRITWRSHPRIDELMWKDDGSRFFGTPYWNNPSLKILHRDEVGELGALDGWLTKIHQQIVPQEALIWAKDATELRQLKTVGVEVEAYHICGLGVEFSAEHTEGRRLVGAEGKLEPDDQEADLPALDGPRIPHRAGAKLREMKGDGNFRIDLDIDEPGGEIITEVFLGWGKYDTVDCLRFRTNRDREIGCSTAPNGCYLGPDAPDKTIVGIIATFAGGPGVSGSDAPRNHTELTLLAALSMSLGIDEETGEESDPEDEGESDEDSEMSTMKWMT